jgi:hypothetical protein
MKSKLYIRCLRKANKLKFSVGENGTKTYWDKEFNTNLGYASGQQAKRCIKESMLENLELEHSIIEFLWNKEGKEGIVKTSADPNDIDQLIFGYMRTDINVGKTTAISCGGILPLHPYLASTFKDSGTMDYTESTKSKIMISDIDKNGPVEFETVLDKIAESKLNTFKTSKFLNPEVLINGIYKYDVQIDLGKLFSVDLVRYKKEIDLSIVDSLLEKGWLYNTNKTRLLLPKQKRDEIADAIAKAIVDFELRSNIGRYYESFTTFAVIVSDSPRKLDETIYAEIVDESTRTANLVVNDYEGLFTSPLIKEHYFGIHNDTKTIDNGIEKISELIKNYNYEG